MSKKKSAKSGSPPPLPTELLWSRSNDNPRSKLTQERGWPTVVRSKLVQDGRRPPSQPWYHTAPERFFDQIEAETLSLWLRLAPKVLEAAHQEDSNSATEQWQILARVGRLIAKMDAYHSVAEILEETSTCTSEAVLTLRAKARDYQKVFHRIENLRLALSLHNGAISDLSDSPGDLGECMRRMTEALAWMVIEGYNLGSMARLVGLRPLEDALLDLRRPHRIGGRNSLVVRLQASDPARREAERLAESYTGSRASLVSHVTKTLAKNGHTHLHARKQVPYSKDTVRDWLRKAGQL